MRRGAGILILLITLASRAAAQSPGPPGPYAIDVRGTMAGLPTTGGFEPAVPPQTVVPARGFGLDAGAHVYPFRIGRVRIGFGASLIRARGTATPVTVKPASPPPATAPKPPPATAPDIATTLVGWSPQLSANFGNHDGWSYASAGVGRSNVRVRASSSASTFERTTDSIPTINFGGWARWWTRDHLAVTFDVRFYMLRAVSTTQPANTAVPGPIGTTPATAAGTPPATTTVAPATTTTVTVTTPRTRLFVLSVGVSLR